MPVFTKNCETGMTNVKIIFLIDYEFTSSVCSFSQAEKPPVKFITFLIPLLINELAAILDLLPDWQYTILVLASFSESILSKR
jgi:hypothetical protein